MLQQNSPKTVEASSFAEVKPDTGWQMVSEFRIEPDEGVKAIREGTPLNLFDKLGVTPVTAREVKVGDEVLYVQMSFPNVRKDTMVVTRLDDLTRFPEEWRSDMSAIYSEFSHRSGKHSFTEKGHHINGLNYGFLVREENSLSTTSAPPLRDAQSAESLTRLCRANPNAGITKCDSVSELSDGSFMGRAELADGRRIPFVGLALIETIDGQAIRDCFDIHTRRDDVLRGRVLLADGHELRLTPLRSRSLGAAKPGSVA